MDGIKKFTHLKKIKKGVATLGLSQNVTITGPMHIDSLNRLSLRSTLNLVCSSYTGFDVVLSELFLPGCQMILWVSLTFEGLAEKSTNCILVSSGSSDELSSAILRFLGSPDNLNLIGEKTRILMEEKLSIEVRADSISSIVDPKYTWR